MTHHPPRPIDRRRLLAGLALALLPGAPRAAPALPAPTGPVLLSVTGAIGATNAGAAAAFDRAMLAGLGTTRFATATIWTDGVQDFAGPTLHALLARVGATGTTVIARAINDYAVDIPVSDAVPDGPILAIERNGRPMPLRDKGPVWLVYPFDRSPDYRTKVIYSRSIWQLDRLHIRA